MIELINKSSTRNRKAYVTLAAALIAFLAYSSVYAFRKPFTVATFDGLHFWGITYQTLLIICQVLGYTLSKFVGIKVISELKGHGRFQTAVTLVGTAWLCLLLFAILPAGLGLICLFVNGFTLGFLWGVIFSYLEGRQATDFIGSVLAVSFIFAGGFTRSVAKWLMINYQVSEHWMPFVTGLIFILPLILLLWALDNIPPPDVSDHDERGVRLPLDSKGRRNLLKQFGPGLAVVTITYLFLTIMRDIRDNYMSNIWVELGYGANYSILTTTETTTSLVVISIMSLLVLIHRNFRAFAVIHFVIIIGFVLVVTASLLFKRGEISGAMWMQLVSVGLYLAYIPFNCIFFERMIATYRIVGNVGFLIYLADSFGYLGSVIIMLVKEFTQVSVSWSQFYANGVVYSSAAGIIGASFSYFYFLKKYRSRVTQTQASIS